MNKASMFATAAFILSSATAYAASQDECSIWLCAPAGFPGSECSAAHSAFLHRIKHGKSPFPSFSSCAVDSVGKEDEQYQVVQGYAAYIPSHKERQCIEYSEMRYGNTGPHRECIKHQDYTVPEKYVEGRGCIHGPQGGTEPSGCTSTFYSLKVFDRQTGEQIGDTYFYNY